MCPDVACLRVHAEHGLEALPERVHRRPVSLDEEVVVLEPLGQVFVVDDHPPRRPDALGKLLGSLEGAQGLGAVGRRRCFVVVRVVVGRAPAGGRSVGLDLIILSSAKMHH